MSQPLTCSELSALDITAELVAKMTRDVIGNGPTRAADVGEFVRHIHAIQHMIMAQAAARAYPAEFRLLGESLGTPVPTKEQQ